MGDDAAIRVVPANAAGWDEVRAVFGVRGQGAVCWCQRFKLAPGEAFRDWPAEVRAERLRRQAGCGGPGPTSGLVAFRGGEPVGWCAVEPRTAYPLALGRAKAQQPSEIKDIAR